MTLRGLAAALLSTAMLSVACSGNGEPEAGAPGFIASVGRDGLTLSTSSGEIVASAASITTQPTWSRDGARVVSSAVDPGGGWLVEVRDGTSADLISSEPAARPYFFYSWRDDGERIAALGPGLIGTTLDILDGQGGLLSEQAVEGRTVFVAWEPGGSDLLVHRDTDLLRLTNRDAPVELGTVGREFQAPAWLPGSRDALVMIAEGASRWLRRISVDGPLDGESVGAAFPPSGLPAWVIVDGSGSRAAVVGSAAEGGISSAAFELGAESRPVQRARTATEVVDLATGERTLVTRAQALWAEWSPTGDQLLVASLEPDAVRATWSVWTDEGLTDLIEFFPSPTFLSDYMPFGDQYVEQPRLWAPDGTAFTFAGRLEGGDAGTVVVGTGEGHAAVTVDGAVVAFWSPLEPSS